MVSDKYRIRIPSPPARRSGGIVALRPRIAAVRSRRGPFHPGIVTRRPWRAAIPPGRATILARTAAISARPGEFSLRGYAGRCGTATKRCAVAAPWAGIGTTPRRLAAPLTRIDVIRGVIAARRSGLGSQRLGIDAIPAAMVSPRVGTDTFRAGSMSIPPFPGARSARRGDVTVPI